MIDKKLNVYYVHRETNEIYWNNLAWGEVGRIGKGMVAVLSLNETRQIVENRIAVEPDNYHIIPGHVVELEYYLTERLATSLVFRCPGIANVYSELEEKIKKDFLEMWGNTERILFEILEHLGNFEEEVKK